MLSNSLQHIDEIVIRIDVVQPAGDEQALYDADVFGTKLGPTEIPIFSAHRDHPQSTFQMIGIDCDIGIVEIDRESIATLTYVGQRRHERTAGQKTLRFELFVDPVEQATYHRFRFG